MLLENSENAILMKKFWSTFTGMTNFSSFCVLYLTKLKTINIGH